MYFNARRLLLIALVLASVAVVLSACETPAIQCGMRDDYRNAQPVPAFGTVTFSYAYRQGFEDRRYGEATGNVIRMKGEPPDHNDICALARLGHEVAHPMGGKHE